MATTTRDKGGVRTSHLSLVDDQLLFVEATEDKIDYIKAGLSSFCSALGQMVNYNKSRIFFSPNLFDHITAALSQRMGIPKTDDLGYYLGHRLLHHGRSSNGYDHLLQKVRDKLSGWKSKCLSRAGRLTLAKIVINSMAIFEMRMGRLLSKDHKELDKAVRNCVWGSLTEQRRIHLLNWDILCRSEACGGGGLRSAEFMNKALLAKLA